MTHKQILREKEMKFEKTQKYKKAQQKNFKRGRPRMYKSDSERLAAKAKQQRERREGELLKIQLKD